MQHQAGDLGAAEQHYREAVALCPGYHAAHNLLATVLTQTGDYTEAIIWFDKAQAIDPNNAMSYNNKGFCLQQLGQLEAALASYQKALELDATYFDAFLNCGIVMYVLGMFEDAHEVFSQIVAALPQHLKAHTMLGHVLLGLGRHTDAEQVYALALALKPDHAEALNGRGVAAYKRKKLHEALKDYDAAIACDPGLASAFNNRGNVLQDLGRNAEALQSFDNAIALDPGFKDAFYNRGNLLRTMQRHSAAMRDFDRVLNLDPAYAEPVLGMAAYCRALLSQWDDLPLLTRRMREAIAKGECVSSPFGYLALCGDPGLQLRCATIYSQKHHAVKPFAQLARTAQPRVRIAYVSADFTNHAVMSVLAEVFECHDRARFEIMAYHYGRKKDEKTSRLQNAFSQFHDVAGWSDEQIACHLQAQGVDIAVDLMGYTSGGRPGILALRPAPVQVNYIGYPGTMGHSCFDYIVADSVLIPHEFEPYYSEKVVRLPGCYLPTDRKRTPAATASRQAVGLPDNAFVFCAFSNSYKITPEVFDVWMRLLKTVSGSVLWLLQGYDATQAGLCNEAHKRGVAPSQLVFMPRTCYEQYLANYQLADLFLDTAPYNALATASDALWMGLPVLTCTGQSYVARGATSIVHAAGLPELATNNLRDYEGLAYQLATHPEKLRHIRDTLSANRETCALFDTPGYVRHLESAYMHMHERAKAGLSPASFSVDAASVAGATI